MTKLQKLLQSIHQGCLEGKGEHLALLDLSNMESYADAVMLASGTNERQIQAIADRIIQKVFSDHKRHPLGVEGMDASEWVLIDFGDVVCHVFSEEAREVYHLEDMWPKVSPILDEAIESYFHSTKQAPRKKAQRSK